eukprot:3804931-Lingulodinium_polyedra.AAC.1
MTQKASEAGRPELPPHHHGFQAGRSRETALLVHGCMAWRSAKARLPLARAHHDLTNAFMTPLHDKMVEAAKELVFERDHELFTTTFLESSMYMQCADGELELTHGCGGLMGSPAV